MDLSKYPDIAPVEAWKRIDVAADEMDLDDLSDVSIASVELPLAS